MAINVPNQLPTGMGSFNQGFKTVGDLMNQIRAHQIERQKLQEAIRQHGEEMKFKQSDEGRAQSKEARAQQLFIEQLKGLKGGNQLNDILMQAMGGGQGGGSPMGTTPTQRPNQNAIPDQVNGSPNQNMSDPNTGILNGQHDVGMDGQPVQGGQESPMGQTEQPMQQSNQPAMDPRLEKIRNNPLLRAMVAHKLGRDPFAETPEQKESRILETNQKKLDQKAIMDAAKSTNAVKTQNQNIVNMVPRANRMIDKLISLPSPTEFPGYRKGARAAHDAMVKEAAETYAKAKGWPNTGESISTASKILDRGQMEMDSDYRKRLEELKKELNLSLSEARGVLNPGEKKSENRPEEKTLNGVKYQKINGEWHTA